MPNYNRIMKMSREFSQLSKVIFNSPSTLNVDHILAIASSSIMYYARGGKKLIPKTYTLNALNNIIIFNYEI